MLRRVLVLEHVCFSAVCLLQHLDEEASRCAHAPPASLNSPMRSNHKPQRPARTGRQESLQNTSVEKNNNNISKKKKGCAAERGVRENVVVTDEGAY